jgi:iron(III) transport system substrate-binding protein
MREGQNADQRKWGEAINVILPTFENGGTHINVSGAVLAKNAPNRENAVKLLEYMTSPEAQRVFANVNYEYPVRTGIEINKLVASFGDLKPDAMSVAEVAKLRSKAAELVDKVAFDR